MRRDVRKEGVAHEKHFPTQQERQGIRAVSRQMIGYHRIHDGTFAVSDRFYLKEAAFPVICTTMLMNL
jgi:hypothetical protein